MSLPALVVFSVSDSNKEERYLSFTGPQRQLRCSVEEGVFNDNVRFAVEPAGDGLVHIRSTYENGYWARRSRFEPWLTASTPEKVEDMSKDECTLFRPRMSQGNVFVGFVHAQSGLNVVMLPPTDAHAYNLSAQAAPPTDFSFIDFSPLTQIKLPRYVMFLGENGKYLSPSAQRPEALIQAAEFNNPTSRAVGFEVVYTKNGDIRLKSMSLDEFVTVIPFIRVPWPVAIDTATKPAPNDPNTIFKPDMSVQLTPARETGIALLSRSHESYIHTWRAFEYVVGEDSPHVSAAWLRPRHAAVQDKRRVNINSFRRAWVAPRSTRLLRTRELYNTTDVEKESMVYTETYRKNTRTTISNDISFFTGPSAVFNGQMPYVRPNGELEFEDVASDVSASWGKTRHTMADDNKHDYTVTLPPRSRVTVSVLIKIVTYEIPFSYQQIDELPFGSTIPQDLDDGVFKIEDEYEVYAEITEVQPYVASEENVGETGVDHDSTKH